MKRLMIFLFCIVMSVNSVNAKEYLLTSARPNKLFLIDAEDGNITRTYDIADQTTGSWSIVPSQTDQRVYVTADNHQVLLGIDLQTGLEVFRAQLNKGDTRARSFYGLDISSDGTKLYAHVNPVQLFLDRHIVLDNEVLVFDTSSGLDAKPINKIDVPRRVQGLMVSSDDKSLYLFGRDYYKIDIHSGQIVETLPVGSWDLESRSPGELGGHWVSFEHSDIQSQAVYSVHNDRDPYTQEAYQTGLVLLDRQSGDFKTVDFEYTADLVFATAASSRKPEVFGVYNSLVKIDSDAGVTIKRIPLEATYYTVNTSMSGDTVFIGGGGCKIAAHKASDLSRLWGHQLPGCADQSFSWLRVVDFDDMTVAPNKELVSTFIPDKQYLYEYQDAWNSHDLEKILDYFSDDIVFEDLPMNLVARSKNELSDILLGTFTQVPDFNMNITSMHMSDDFAVIEWWQSGTASGDIEGGNVEGKEYKVKTTSIIRFTGGRIVGLSDNWDASLFYKD